jgi:predicted RNase H-like HicB family nuclease
MKYQVLVENGTNNLYTATVVGLPECRAQATTKQEAVTKVHDALMERLDQAEIVWLDVPNSTKDHPWLHLLGIHQDNPLFEDVQAEIEAYRRQLDNEQEAE